MPVKVKNKFAGSKFDNFLSDEGILVDVQTAALKEVLVWQLIQEMKKKKINKSEMAKRMHTSRAAVDRLLDPHNTSLTIRNLEKAAHVVDKSLKIELCSN
jgi:antitoxin HicB